MNNNQAELREAAGKLVMEEVGRILMQLNSNESGRILETTLQLLSPEVFNTMAFLIIGNEFDNTARSMIYEFVFRIASKLGLEFQNLDLVNEAASTTAVLLSCEQLRRKGHMEYLAPDDIFSLKPKFPGYNRLTESGKKLAYTEILEAQPAPKYVM
jgi:hypothetical protein